MKIMKMLTIVMKIKITLIWLSAYGDQTFNVHTSRSRLIEIDAYSKIQWKFHFLHIMVDMMKCFRTNFFLGFTEISRVLTWSYVVLKWKADTFDVSRCCQLVKWFEKQKCSLAQKLTVFMSKILLGIL